MTERPDWDAYFLAGAQWAGTRATCPKRSVGALIVREQRIIASGYNGAPAGESHCDEIGCLERDGHCIRAMHAEENAIIHATVPVVGATIYLDGGSPCYRCARLLIAVEVRRVVFRGRYDDDEALAMLSRSGVVVQEVRV
ncbi:MAG TPA: dCMP deaminase family protein [Chloroflexota bacterium]